MLCLVRLCVFGHFATARPLEPQHVLTPDGEFEEYAARASQIQPDPARSSQEFVGPKQSTTQLLRSERKKKVLRKLAAEVLFSGKDNGEALQAVTP